MASVRNFILFLTVFLFYACKKFVDIPPPINPIVSAIIFTNDQMAIGTVTGIYHEMMNSANNSNQFSSAGITLYAGMAADELRYFIPGQRDEFIKNQLTEMSHASIATFFWDRAYKYIYTANLCIEQLTKSTHLKDSVRNRLLGECHFIRAFCYFHLVNLFGGVPLPTSSDYRVNEILPRSTVNNVYDLIINDLLNAESRLPADTPVVRPGKLAAAGLLARVYLYREDWVNAEAQASAVINSGNYFLEGNLNKVFLRNSREAIWQLIPVNNNVNTWEGNLIIPPASSSAPGYILTDTLYHSFEAQDLRKINWIKSHVFPTGGAVYYYPYKYKVRNSSVITENYMMLRLAEQYLIRAEARARQNNLVEARTDLDIIRNRAGLPATMAITQNQLLAAIEQERRTEFFAEWGHRWYDLKRTNRANAVLGGQKATWQLNDALWPIPIAQLNANPSLTQNPGY